jgi:N-acetylmuramoyl-L-alanine amidase
MAPRLTLRLLIKDFNEQPIINTACTLEVEGAAYQLTTNANGQIQQQISASARTGRLRILDLELPIQIGHLDPVEEVSGQQARLNNLGYDAGEVGEEDEAKLRSALEEFQCDQSFTVDGICDPQTQARLLEVHGC